MSRESGTLHDTRMSINATGMVPDFLIIIFAVFSMTIVSFECLRTIRKLGKADQSAGKGGLRSRLLSL